mgnify:CR=1 FL=1
MPDRLRARGALAALLLLTAMPPLAAAPDGSGSAQALQKGREAVGRGDGIAGEVELRRALDGGEDGLEAYRAIACGMKAFLEADGHAALEIGASQKADVERIFRQAGFALAEARRDFGGNDRVLVFANA